ncbi:MAG TPA: hypothetical protein VJ001_01645, partial [Rhodocyclaceae bacterium]|nr:hypothetical protein [Rhodocyclaceae bacterium]
STTTTETGTAVGGGALAYATVCVDTNNDGCATATQKTTTKSDGTYTLTGNGSAVTVVGGYNIDSLISTSTTTDLATALTAATSATEAAKYFTPFVGSMKAPSGSTTVTPLTTMAQSLVESGSATSFAAAETTLKTQLGIDATVDLKSSTSLANKTVMTNLEGVGRILRQATAAMAASAKLDAVDINTGTATQKGNYVAMYSNLVAGFAKEVGTTKLDLTDSTKSSTIQTSVESAIKTAYTSVQKSSLFKASSDLSTVDSGAIAAMAAPSIVDQAQTIATAMKAIPDTNFGTGKTFASVQAAMKSEKIAEKLTNLDQASNVQFEVLKDSEMRKMMAPAVVAASTTEMLTQFRETTGAKLKDVQNAALNNGFKSGVETIVSALTEALATATQVYNNVKAKDAAFAAKVTTFTPIADQTAATTFSTNVMSMASRVMSAANVTSDDAKGLVLSNVVSATRNAFENTILLQPTIIINVVNNAFAPTVNNTTNTVTIGGINVSTTAVNLMQTATQTAMNTVITNGVAAGTLTGTALTTAQNTVTTANTTYTTVINNTTVLPPVTIASTSKVTPKNVTVNGTKSVTLSNSGQFDAITLTESASYLGGLSTVSFTLDQGTKPLGDNTTKVVPVGLDIAPTSSTTDKRRLSLVVQGVVLSLDSNGKLQATVPTTAKLSFSATDGSGKVINGVLSNAAADLVSVSNGTYTLNVGAVTNGIATALAKFGTSLAKVDTQKGSYNITAVIGGLDLSDVTSSTNSTLVSYASGSVQAGAASAVGKAMKGVVTVQ